MTLRCSSLLVLLSNPGLIFLVHALATRWMSGSDEQPTSGSRQKVALLAGIMTSVAVTALIAALEQSLAPFRLAFCLGIALLQAHVYFHLFNMSETARRIRLLVALYRGHAFETTGYTAAHLIRVRLERLRALDQITEENGRFRAKPTVLWCAARVVDAIERLLFASALSRSARQRTSEAKRGPSESSAPA